MGDSESFYRPGDKSPSNRNGTIHNHSHWRKLVTSKRPYSKMEAKTVGIWICDTLGITSALLGWVNNLDNVKSTILFIMGLIYFLVRTYFFIVEKNIAIRKARFEQKQREKTV